MQLHDIKKNKTNRNKKRIGRGGARGKTSGKGMKGQKSRAGNSIRPAIRDIIKKIPKLRGHGIHGNKNREIINKFFAVNLSDLEKAFQDKDVVNPTTLLEKKVVKREKGRTPRVKILGNGKITKKLIIENLSVSQPALEKLKKAGSKIK